MSARIRTFPHDKSQPRSAQDFMHYTAVELNELYIEDGDDWWPLPVDGDATLTRKNNH